MEVMDRIIGIPILEAACDGNVEFLLERLATEHADYFLIRSRNTDGDPELNIIHVAVLRLQVEFLKRALGLPSSTVHLLLCHTVLPPPSNGCNALHFAVAKGDLTIVKLLVKFAQLSFPSTSSSSSSLSKPWLTEDNKGRTPLQMAFEFRREHCALEIMLLDMELQCNMVNSGGISPLFLAVFYGFSRVAVKILTSSHSYSTRGYDGNSPLDVAPVCTEEVCRLLLDKHPEMLKKVDEKGMTILHKWILLGKVWPFELMLKGDTTSAWRKDFINLICMTDQAGRNALHAAAYHSSEEIVQIAQLLVEAYNHEEKGGTLQMIPWKQRDNNNITPPYMALHLKNEKIALYYISLLEVDELFMGENLLYNAVKNGCGEAAETLLMKMVDYPYFTELVNIRGDDGTGKNVLHVASNCTETTATLLVEKLPWMINECDDNEKTPLDVASELGTAWLIQLLLTKEPSSTLCLQVQDSPMHHIKLGSYSQYQEFYAIPLIQGMKNMLDSNHSTPLNRALERNDILLAELLLSDDSVSKAIQDNSGNTATSLLVELCNQDDAWEAMCRRVGINPRLRTNFIQPNTMGVGASIPSAIAASVGEMRGTVSVVAALLATLTFAAGFTVPGGLDQVTGEALLANKVSFLVFIIADTYAMCCAMLVLFFLMWSMVIDDQDRSLILVDRSVLILIQSLYGTLLAFMTAVFTVISHKSLWASIVVFFMCSLVALVAVSANRTYLYKFLDKLAPSAITKRRNLTRSLEEEQKLHQGVVTTVRNQIDDPLSSV